MKKLLAIFFSFSISISQAYASEMTLFEEVYKTVKKEYIKDVEISSLMVKGFEGLKNLDDKVRVTENNNKIEVYYDNYLLRSLEKKEGYEEKGYARMTLVVFELLRKKSEKLRTKDFEMSEYFLYSMFANLDGDSKYYPYLDIGSYKVNKKQRYFAKDILDGNVLYIKPGPLNRNTKDTIINTLVEHDDYKGIILDLRGNPGGLIGEAVSVMNIFLDNGIIVSTKGRNDEEESYYIADGTSMMDNRPMVVLVDENTASSAEILASSIKEQSLGKLVGSRTRGKGTVQKLVVLENGGELALTSSYFFTPAGGSINKSGVFPDICTSELDDKLSPTLILDNKNNMTRYCTKQNREGKDMDVLVALEMING